MTEGHYLLRIVLAAILVCFGCAAGAQELARVRVGYLELDGDPRYSADRAYAGIALRAPGRPFAGAEVALAESESIGRIAKARFSLERFSGPDVEALASAVERWSGEGIGFILADLPAAELAQVAARLRDKPLLLFNVSAGADELRGPKCQPNLLHTLPSEAMRADALAQHLALRKWMSVLVLQGPAPEDGGAVAAFRRAAGRFGLKLVDARAFELSNDPRDREQNNVALITGGADYDVVFVADSDGEYARYVPYQTQRPRPVVGATGLRAEAWHWAWERNGGPQVNSRFQKHAERPMAAADWAAWAALKAVAQAVLRTRSTDFAANRDFIRGERFTLDGSKGSPMSFRHWDGQLRQPLFLATHDAVIERAPLRGFLHRTNDLDTLGYDEPETACRR
jgi:ABC transporter substrate binding protein (PQQ-dependent alcohol dehydrogenase system)